MLRPGLSFSYFSYWYANLVIILAKVFPLHHQLSSHINQKKCIKLLTYMAPYEETEDWLHLKKKTFLAHFNLLLII